MGLGNREGVSGSADEETWGPGAGIRPRGSGAAPSSSATDRGRLGPRSLDRSTPTGPPSSQGRGGRRAPSVLCPGCRGGTALAPRACPWPCLGGQLQWCRVGRQVAPARCASCSRLKDLLPRKAGGATRRKPQQAAQREGGRGRAPAPLAWAWAAGCGWELCCQASHTVRPLPVAVGEPPRVVRGAAGPVAGGDPAPGRPAGVGQVQQTGAER